ncbi:hypothetical protein Tcan_02435 [Toxocara canis]|uniref:Uncharacterized protein n=1 Tax=Toxocara canis TaxID=6265 RepID=A0A0B2UQJ2_TOXCA|nr:hypothetical protein Tcan_02435 [Toxocara canis]
MNLYFAELIERRRQQMESELKSPEERARDGDAANSDTETAEPSLKSSAKNAKKAADENDDMKMEDHKNGEGESEGDGDAERERQKEERSPEGDASMGEGSDGEEQPTKRQLSDDENEGSEETNEAGKEESERNDK